MLCYSCHGRVCDGGRLLSIVVMLVNGGLLLVMVRDGGRCVELLLMVVDCHFGLISNLKAFYMNKRCFKDTKNALCIYIFHLLFLTFIMFCLFLDT